MTTTTKSKKQASTKATASISIPTAVYKTAERLAKEDGMPVTEWLEKLVATNSNRQDKLPIYLPAETVRFLAEVSEAGGIDVDEFANGVLGDIVSGSLAGMGDAESLVLDSWQHDDREADEIAMKAVVARWRE